MKSYCQRYQPPLALRFSLSPFHRQAVPLLQPKGDAPRYQLMDIPLYAISRLPQLLDAVPQP